MKFKDALKAGLIVLFVGAIGLYQAVCPPPADAKSKTEKVRKSTEAPSKIKVTKRGEPLVRFVLVEEPVEEPHKFFDDWKNTTFSGYIIDGEQKAYLENITVFEPEGESFLGIPLTKAQLTVVSFDGTEIVDRLWLIGRIGSINSDTFYLSWFKLDEPFDINAGGVAYDITKHWDSELQSMIVGVHLLENGNLMYSYYFEWEIDTGYYLGADILLGMESAWNRDFLEGKIWGKHNFEPDGSTYGEIFVINIGGKTTVGGGVGFTF